MSRAAFGGALAGVLCALTVAPAWSLSEDAARAQLEKSQKALEASQKAEARLQGNIQAMEKELERLSQETVSVAKRLQSQEGRISAMERKIDDLEREKEAKQERLHIEQQQVQAAMATLIRMGRVPPQAVLMMPSGVEGKIKSARSLGLMAGEMQKEVLSLAAQVDDIAAIQEQILAKQGKVTRSSKSMLTQRKQLRQRIAERKKLVRQLHGNQLQEQRAINDLLKRSKNMKSLLSSLEEARSTSLEKRFAAIGVPKIKPFGQKKAAPRTKKKQSPKSSKQAESGAKSFAGAKGKMALPVAGRIMRGFGRKLNANETLKGIEIKARSGAQVTAPFSGEVMFSGEFLSYGKMVILRHSSTYHTLIAGFEDINIAPGQHVAEGEPIGEMPRKKSGNKLYLELRKKGRPINPSPWFRAPTNLAQITQ